MPLKQNWWGDPTITPIASLNYVHTAIGKYIESGAGDLNLEVAEQDYNFLQMGLGGKISWDLMQNWGRLVPNMHARWLYDFIGDEAQTTSSFTGGGPTFTTTGYEPAQGSVNVGVGVDLLSKGNIAFLLNYDFETKEDFTAHYGSATVRITY